MSYTAFKSASCMTGILDTLGIPPVYSLSFCSYLCIHISGRRRTPFLERRRTSLACHQHRFCHRWVLSQPWSSSLHTSPLCREKEITLVPPLLLIFSLRVNMTSGTFNQSSLTWWNLSLACGSDAICRRWNLSSQCDEGHATVCAPGGKGKARVETASLWNLC